MSTLPGSTAAEVDTIISSLDENTSDNSNKSHSHKKYVLRHKNLLKHRTRCKVLRKKLKKYKLRKDDIDDQDVLDVSEVFHNGLLIKSPQKKYCSSLHCKIEGYRPKNYLFKMARRKHKAKTEKLNVSQTVDTPKDIGIASISPVTTSQEQKTTNAFKLMMHSRNKSIGGNSPGKEKNIDPSDLQEISDKKNMKAKRTLVLQKMAEAKGALKKMEIEEFQEKCIQRKMEKRAERLKEMITNKNSKTSNGQEIKSKSSKHIDKKSKPQDDNINCQPTVTNGGVKPSKAVVLFNIFNGVLKDPMNISPDEKSISKEDEAFLKKLSPSLKKKENMLCYFKKIEKQQEPTVVEIDPEINTSPIMKIKLTAKTKKKQKRKKLSLKKEEASEDLKHHNENKYCISGSTDNNIKQKENKVTESRKRKREVLLIKELANNNEVENDEQSKLEEGRPKRHVRRPVKYIDDVELYTSDEEWQVFTPKKKRHLESKKKTAAEDDVRLCDEKPKKVAKSKKVYRESKQNHSTKLAPIFAKKLLLNQEQLEARQKFLYSGVPDQLKKIIAQQINTNSESSNSFPIVVHVQQIDLNKMRKSNQFSVSYSKFDDNQNEDEETIDDTSLFHRLVKITEKKHKSCIEVKKNSVSTVLQSFKECYPKFPVYRTYRMLEGVSKGELKDLCTDLESSVEILNGFSETVNEGPEHLNWTVKYKPMSTKQLLGNFESIKELKKWLQSWTENHARVKNTLDSDSSDFYDSDMDSNDSTKAARNMLILTGPIGSGKTCSVYSVAAELAMKVIEVNASSKRTGKMMLQDLQEATQSHKVNRENSQKSQEVVEPLALKTYKKKGRPKKLSNENLKSVHNKEVLSQQSSNQEVGRTAMSLILIDDADIVFDQDDGFCSAIAQLVESSKRPVVLVTASLSCPHLQRFLQIGKVIKMRPFSPRMLGTWLDLLCLADSGTCWPGLGAKFLDYFKGDVRKTINNLQFYMTTQESAVDGAMSQNSNIKSSLTDDSSCISWADSEGAEVRSINPKFTIGLENEIWKSFVLQQSTFLHSTYSVKLMDLWWNVPQFSNDSSNIKLSQAEDHCKEKQKQCLELKALADIVDSLSVSDYFNQLTPDTGSNISSLPWYTSESDSVSENENFNCYSRSKEIHNEIMNHLTISSVMGAQKVFGLEKDIDIQFPDMTAQR